MSHIKNLLIFILSFSSWGLAPSAHNEEPGFVDRFTQTVGDAAKKVGNAAEAGTKRAVDAGIDATYDVLHRVRHAAARISEANEHSRRGNPEKAKEKAKAGTHYLFPGETPPPPVPAHETADEKFDRKLDEFGTTLNEKFEQLEEKLSEVWGKINANPELMFKHSAIGASTIASITSLIALLLHYNDWLIVKEEAAKSKYRNIAPSWHAYITSKIRSARLSTYLKYSLFFAGSGCAYGSFRVIKSK